jgi:hypothetical protein
MLWLSIETPYDFAPTLSLFTLLCFRPQMPRPLSFPLLRPIYQWVSDHLPDKKGFEYQDSSRLAFVRRTTTFSLSFSLPPMSRSSRPPVTRYLTSTDRLHHSSSSRRSSRFQPAPPARERSRSRGCFPFFPACLITRHPFQLILLTTPAPFLVADTVITASSKTPGSCISRLSSLANPNAVPSHPNRQRGLNTKYDRLAEASSTIAGISRKRSREERDARAVGEGSMYAFEEMDLEEGRAGQRIRPEAGGWADGSRSRADDEGRLEVRTLECLPITCLLSSSAPMLIRLLQAQGRSREIPSWLEHTLASLSPSDPLFDLNLAPRSPLPLPPPPSPLVFSGYRDPQSILEKHTLQSPFPSFLDSPYAASLLAVPEYLGQVRTTAYAPYPASPQPFSYPPLYDTHPSSLSQTQQQQHFYPHSASYLSHHPPSPIANPSFFPPPLSDVDSTAPSSDALFSLFHEPQFHPPRSLYPTGSNPLSEPRSSSPPAWARGQQQRPFRTAGPGKMFSGSDVDSSIGAGREQLSWVLKEGDGNAEGWGPVPGGRAVDDGVIRTGTEEGNELAYPPPPASMATPYSSRPSYDQQSYFNRSRPGQIFNKLLPAEEDLLPFLEGLHGVGGAGEGRGGRDGSDMRRGDDLARLAVSRAPPSPFLLQAIQLIWYDLVWFFLRLPLHLLLGHLHSSPNLFSERHRSAPGNDLTKLPRLRSPTWTLRIPISSGLPSLHVPFPFILCSPFWARELSRTALPPYILHLYSQMTRSSPSPRRRQPPTQTPAYFFPHLELPPRQVVLLLHTLPRRNRTTCHLDRRRELLPSLRRSARPLAK